MHILIVEDDPAATANLQNFLEARGHSVDGVGNGIMGLRLAVIKKFDGILLEVGVSWLDGISFCHKLRQNSQVNTPLLILTARDTLDDKLEGFESGADDYLVKPFVFEEVEARLLAMHRRHGHKDCTRMLKTGELSFDPKTLDVRFAGTGVKLSSKCIELLALMIDEPGRVFSREELETTIWGEPMVTSDTLRTHIHELRRALRRAGGCDLIETIHGMGYRLVYHA